MLLAASEAEPAVRYGIGRFLSRRHLILTSLFLSILVLGLWVAWVCLIARVTPVKEEFRPRLDFQVFWSASSLALDGEAASAYTEEAMRRVQFPLHRDESGFFPWLNPPTFFFFVLPLALVPVWAALVAWVTVTGGLAVTAARRIMPDRMLATLLTLVFPATAYNMLIGQNGLLTAGLFAWGMLLLRDRPVLAGATLGLMAYKPQFLPLVLIALVAARQKQAVAGALASIGGLALASLVVFGASSWEGFLHVASVGDSIYKSDGSLGVELSKMQSVSATLLLLGVPSLAALVLQGAVALAAAGFVVWLWRSDVAMEYKAGGLAIAVLLATPYSYHYDLPLLGLAALWLGVRFQRDGWRPWDAEVLLIAFVTPFLALVAGINLNIAIGPIVLVLLLAVLLRRVRQPRVQALPVLKDQQAAVAT